MGIGQSLAASIPSPTGNPRPPSHFKCVYMHVSNASCLGLLVRTTDQRSCLFVACSPALYLLRTTSLAWPWRSTIWSGLLIRHVQYVLVTAHSPVWNQVTTTTLTVCCVVIYIVVVTAMQGPYSIRTVLERRGVEVTMHTKQATNWD